MSNLEANMDRDAERRRIALKRWKLLIDVLIKKKQRFDTTCSISVRRFSSFGLLHTSRLGEDDETQHLWYRYSCPAADLQSLKIRHLQDNITVENLLGFNNTGNVCVWPSEEVLTYYVLQSRQNFDGKSVIELGGGMTCLAGMALAVSSGVKHMVLTDGNARSVQNLDVIIKKNMDQIGDTQVEARMLLWNDLDTLGSLKEAFDYVICADCFFFDDCRRDLAQVIHKLLKPKGEAILFAPQRGTTFELFVEEASSSFHVRKEENYDDHIWNLHHQNLQKGEEAYDPNLHYPIYLHLMKKDQ